MSKKYLISNHKIIIYIIISIAAFELGLRLFFSEQLTYPDRPAIYMYNPEVGYVYIPDTCFYIGKQLVCTNEQGFLDTDFGEDSVDTFRIAFVGSSSIAGSIHLKEYYNFCTLLQRKFYDNNMKVRILNCGIDGGERSFEIFKSIKYQVEEYKPDLILMEYNLPFFSVDVIRENYRGYIYGYPSHDKQGKANLLNLIDSFYKYRSFITILHKSYILRALMNLYVKNNDSKSAFYIKFYRAKIYVQGDFIPKQYTMEESSDLLHGLINDLENMNTQFYLFQYGNWPNILDTVTKFNLPLLNLELTFEPTDLFYKDDHFHKKGCQKVADRFYETLINEKLIPEEYAYSSKVNE